MYSRRICELLFSPPSEAVYESRTPGGVGISSGLCERDRKNLRAKLRVGDRFSRRLATSKCARLRSRICCSVRHRKAAAQVHNATAPRKLTTMALSLVITVEYLSTLK
jgi:hypothetical protein